jgi:cytochrome P450
MDPEFVSTAFRPERWLAGGSGSGGGSGKKPTLLSFHYGAFTCLGTALYMLEAKVWVWEGGGRGFEGVL